MDSQQLSSYYHSHHSPATASPTNGLLPPSSSSAVLSGPPDSAKRKRGRPRKYGTPEQALAAKKATASAHRERKSQHRQGFSSSSPSPSSRKSHFSNLRNTGQGFTPHVITVAEGEDVAQKILFFMQQSNREICILSGSGAISSASVRQPAISGGNITYQGLFEIITLSGSYVRTDLGGRSGGLSICLSDSSGQIIGGGVGGPLMAAGPVQVIMGSFSIDQKDDIGTSVINNPSGKLPTIPSSGFRAAGIDSLSQSPYIVQSGARI